MSEPKPSRWSEEDLARFRERDARVDALSDRLGETHHAPRQKIRFIARCWGIEFVHETVEEAERIQNRGGMKTEDGVQRTLGGVFFRLVRDAKKDDRDYLRVFPKRPWKSKRPKRDGQSVAAGGGTEPTSESPEA